MYKRNIYTVLENKNIAKDVYRMVLEGDTSFITAPGQFINIEKSSKKRGLKSFDFSRIFLRFQDFFRWRIL